MGIAEGVAALSAFGLVRQLCGGGEAHGILRKGALFGGMLKDRTRESSWYEGCKAWLLKNGAGYHYSRKITPEGLLTVDFICHGVPSPGVFSASLEELQKQQAQLQKQQQSQILNGLN